MKAVLRLARRVVNAELESLNLTGAEGDILFHLLSKRDGLSQEKLAEHLDVGKAAISRTVDSLANKGYVQRERRLDDARAYRITLTPAAKEAAEKIEYAYNAVYEAAMGEIDASEFQCVSALLEKVYQNLHPQEAKNDD